MEVNLKLTKEEADVCIQLWDAAVKSLGLNAVNAAAVLLQKLNEAISMASIKEVEKPENEINEDS